MPEKISWGALEYVYKEKTREWFWAFGIIVLSITAASIILDNYLFAVLVILSAFIIIMFSFRRPNLVDFELNRSGVVIEKNLFPYASLDSFWVEENDARKKILIKSKKIMMPLIVIPLEENDPNAVRDFLKQFISEVEHHEPATQKLMEHFGF